MEENEMRDNETARKRNYERYLEGETGNPQPEHGAYDAYQDNANPYNAYQNNTVPNAGGQSNDQNGYNPNYTQPQPTVNISGLEEPVSIGEWFVSMLLTMIPCVGIVMVFIWAFSKTEKKSKSNFFKMQLIITGVVLAIYFVIIVVSSVAFMSVAK